MLLSPCASSGSPSSAPRRPARSAGRRSPGPVLAPLPEASLAPWRTTGPLPSLRRATPWRSDAAAVYPRSASPADPVVGPCRSGRSPGGCPRRPSHCSCAAQSRPSALPAPPALRAPVGNRSCIRGIPPRRSESGAGRPRPSGRACPPGQPLPAGVGLRPLWVSSPAASGSLGTLPCGRVGADRPGGLAALRRTLPTSPRPPRDPAGLPPCVGLPQGFRCAVVPQCRQLLLGVPLDALPEPVCASPPEAQPVGPSTAGKVSALRTRFPMLLALPTCAAVHASPSASRQPAPDSR